jgi:hypothetical protein
MILDEHINMLRGAELQFRLACAVHLATTNRKQPLDLPIVWTHGQHQVTYEEIALTLEGADFAAMLLKRAATYLMAVQIQEALTALANNDARNHTNADVRSSFEIARLIRNGFAHHPLQPKWMIDPPCRNQVYSVDKIIELDTTHLDGEGFDWRHYGGPLALLRLSEFVRTKLLGDSGSFGSKRDRQSIPTPEAHYYQQGHLILRGLGVSKSPKD